MLTAAGTSESYRISDITASNLLTATHYDDYTISQYGLKSGSSSSLIDQLVYHDNTSSNRLKNVVDGANDATTTLGDFHYTGTKVASAVNYIYDSKGNMSSDANKNISGIVYNYLNLPERITPTGKVLLVIFTTHLVISYRSPL